MSALRPPPHHHRFGGSWTQPWERRASCDADALVEGTVFLGRRRRRRDPGISSSGRRRRWAPFWTPGAMQAARGDAGGRGGRVVHWRGLGCRCSVPFSTRKIRYSRGSRGAPRHDSARMDGRMDAASDGPREHAHGPHLVVPWRRLESLSHDGHAEQRTNKLYINASDRGVGEREEARDVHCIF